MINLIIRRLKKEDAEAIQRIDSTITKMADQQDFKRMVEELAVSPGNMSYVAEYDGEIVGYMISYLVIRGFGIQKSAWIAAVGVEPRYMGQGIGKALANEIFNYYSKKGIHNIYTSVRWDSTDMLQFLKTLGFDRSEFINLRKKIEL